jgi:hypothetical protein
MIIKSKYLSALGILMMLSMVGCTENVDFSEATFNSPEATDGDTAANTAMAKIVAYAINSTNPAPTVEDYEAVGIENVDAANLSAVNTRVAATDATGVDIVEKIKKIAAAVVAMAKIKAYAVDSTTNSAPEVADYAVVGADTTNLKAVNTRVAQAGATGVDTVAKVKAIVAMVKIVAYASDSTNNSAPIVDNYNLAGVTNVTDANLNAVNYGLGEGISTVEQIQAIVDAVVTLSSSITINNSAEGVVLSVDDVVLPSGDSIYIQGVVDDDANVVNVSMEYTVTGSAPITLPAYSKTVTINAENSVSSINVTFKWEPQNDLVGSGTFNATITTNSRYNAKKLKIKKDINAIVVATFSYPRGGSSTLGTATLKIIQGIKD